MAAGKAVGEERRIGHTHPDHIASVSPIRLPTACESGTTLGNVTFVAHWRTEPSDRARAPRGSGYRVRLSHSDVLVRGDPGGPTLLRSCEFSWRAALGSRALRARSCPAFIRNSSLEGQL
jgi:hypothetical protein